MPIYVVGDFNVRLDRPDDPHAIQLRLLVDCYRPVMRATGPTHELGGTLVTVITHDNNGRPACVTVAVSGGYERVDISTRCWAALAGCKRLQYPLPHFSRIVIPVSFVVFLFPDQPMSSLLIRTLLQIGGIEQNPGPVPTWTCAVCSGIVNHGHTSVLCSQCNGWCRVRQTRCSQLSSTKLWINQHICPACTLPIAPVRQPASSVPPLMQSRDHTKPKALKILQFYCNGLSKKMPERLCFMEKIGIQIAALRETKLAEKSTTPTVPHQTMRSSAVIVSEIKVAVWHS